MCVVCGHAFTPDCVHCQTQGRLSSLKLLTDMPWPVHQPQWMDATQTEMRCSRCGVVIRPEMTMRELFGPCSAKTEVEA
ncbi:MAG: hypothetical protein KGI98_14935 [Euryarchaeota archaeon]|nr:hypothetical protein [Euryarchaeota archaeon]MDE1879463.1 hypothetical protein [Euryarchaeota archaeon]